MILKLKIILLTFLFTISSAYAVQISNRQFRKNIVKSAKSQLGTQYQYGGTNNRGFDCSGFTMYIFRKNGVNLPRSSKEQYRFGRKINYKRGQAGDLIFFDVKGSGISHVGIYLGNGKFIHSPRKGKSITISSLKIKYWQKRYVAIARYWDY